MPSSAISPWRGRRRGFCDLADSRVGEELLGVIHPIDLARRAAKQRHWASGA
jgi:hypothetical protein